MKRTVLILGAGGGGGNNLIRSLRQSDLDLRIVGANCLPHAAAKSTADETHLLPESSKPNYLEKLVALVRRAGVDLVIPNNDREVAAVSRNRASIPARTFLPSHDVIETCQNKDVFLRKLMAAGAVVPQAVSVTSLDEIEACMGKLPPSEKYWVRPHRGSGSKGATWVRNAVQARKWIELWVELRGFKASEFQIANFLPGRDYNVQTVWKNGKLIVAKVAQRLSYYMGDGRLSGMSSTPEIARTRVDHAALENVFQAIRALTPDPNGNFNVDMKGDAQGKMHLNEINIGRFPMITTIHDSTGRINCARAYVRCAFDEYDDVANPVDMVEDYFLIRELDTEPLVVFGPELDKRFAESGVDWRASY